jgi:hypothetical protein
MQISYINKKLAKLLGNQKEVMRTFGPDNGKRILRRLDWNRVTQVTVLEIADTH